MAQTYLIDKNGQQYVRKEVGGDKFLGIDKLKKQLDWIIALDKDLASQFPQIIDYNFDNCNYGYYDMTFHDMSTLHRYIINQGQIDTGIENILYQMMLFGSELAKQEVKSNKCQINYIVNDHINKMLKRCSDVKNEDFNKILNNKKLVINGKEYLNLKELINLLYKNDKLITFLAPQKWSISHGDFTLQNILTDGQNFKIIDPRGEGEDSIYYDISKLLQSCHGKYDLMYEGNYQCQYNLIDSTINYKFFNNEALFDQIYDIIKKLIPITYGKLEKHWYLKALFYEASHFISMVPFRYKENLEITILCYAIGIKLLNEVLEEWKKIKN